ncbi:hypothetical protein RQP46_004201 [Phenoliferia psychrophenolica]
MERISKLTIDEARATLGVDSNSTPDEIKAAYKKAALETHPDKNSNSPESTLLFQRVSAAYETCTKYREAPPGFGGNGGFSFRRPRHTHFEDDSDDDEDDDSDGESYYDSEDEYGGYGDEDEGPYGHSSAFFEFLFSNMMNGGGGGGGGGRQNRNTPFGSRAAFEQFRQKMHPETDQQRHARLAREDHERQLRTAARLKADEQRRKQEQIDKAERERLREEEMALGAFRRSQKLAQKKSSFATKRAAAPSSLATLLASAQKRRSEVFGAAREGRSEEVRKGVYEDNAKKEEEEGETLVIIAAKHDDVELVEWLIDHGASPDERDSNAFTALHHSLILGLPTLVSYFLSSHPPTSSSPSPSSDPDAFHPLPPEWTLLSLAVTSSSATVLKLQSAALKFRHQAPPLNDSNPPISPPPAGAKA